MIGDVLLFLKNHLNAHLQASADGDEPTGDLVVFVDGDKMDPISFKLGAVSLLLINVEEERVLRAADPYSRVQSDGSRVKVQPDIRMNLYMLFVARFKQYQQGWTYLSRIIQYFQSHRVLDRHLAPDLADGVDRLVMELVTLEFAELNEVWNALRTTHHPSVLYRVKLMVFRDGDERRAPELGERVLATKQ